MRSPQRLRQRTPSSSERQSDVNKLLRRSEQENQVLTSQLLEARKGIARLIAEVRGAGIDRCHCYSTEYDDNYRCHHCFRIVTTKSCAYRLAGG